MDAQQAARAARRKAKAELRDAEKKKKALAHKYQEDRAHADAMAAGAAKDAALKALEDAHKAALAHAKAALDAAKAALDAAKAAAKAAHEKAVQAAVDKAREDARVAAEARAIAEQARLDAAKAHLNNDPNANAQAPVVDNTPPTMVDGVLLRKNNRPPVHHPLDCEVGAWGDWSDCSLTCGKGLQTRSRSIKEAIDGGKACGAFVAKEMRNCFTECPVDCKLGDWSALTACSKTCGGGIQTRTRKLLPAQFGGACLPEVANAPLVKTVECNIQGCSDNDCKLSSWGEWSQCSATCGGGARVRVRAVVPNGPGGKPCTHDQLTVSLKEVEPCGTNACPTDCAASEWSQFTSCSATCGDGTRTRSRTIFPPSHGGAACPSTLLSHEVVKCKMVDCPEDCVAGPWSSWSACDKQCGPGRQVATRQISPAKFGGKPCADDLSIKFETCQLKACPPPIDCTMSAWGSWSTCSVSCGSGTQTRDRVMSPAHNGGAHCADETTHQTQQCDLAPCPVQGRASMLQTNSRLRKKMI